MIIDHPDFNYYRQSFGMLPLATDWRVVLYVMVVHRAWYRNNAIWIGDPAGGAVPAFLVFRYNEEIAWMMDNYTVHVREGRHGEHVPTIGAVWLVESWLKKVDAPQWRDQIKAELRKKAGRV